MLRGTLYAEWERRKECMLPVRVTLATKDLSTTEREWSGAERNKAKMSSARMKGLFHYCVMGLVLCWHVRGCLVPCIYLQQISPEEHKGRLKISHFPSLSMPTLPKPKLWLARASFMRSVFSSKDTVSTLE